MQGKITVYDGFHQPRFKRAQMFHLGRHFAVINRHGISALCLRKVEDHIRHGEKIFEALVPIEPRDVNADGRSYGDAIKLDFFSTDRALLIEPRPEIIVAQRGIGNHEFVASRP